MNITEKDIEKLQQFLANEMEEAPAKQFQERLKTDTELQLAEKILADLPQVATEYFDQQTQQQNSNKSAQVVQLFSTNIRKIAAVLVIGIIALVSIFYVYTPNQLSNQQIAYKQYQEITEYYEMLESERGDPINGNLGWHVNSLQENYEKGKTDLNNQSFTSAIEKLNNAYIEARQQQNPLQYEIRLLLAMAYIGTDDTEKAALILKDLMKQQRIPSSLQAAIATTLRQIE